MKNSNRILVTNGDKKYQRELVTALRNVLDINFYDVEVSYDYYKATVEATSNVEFTRQLSNLMTSEDEYRFNYLFIIDDYSERAVAGAFELLFEDFNSSNHRSFKPNWVVFVFGSSPRNKIDLDVKLIQRTVTEGYNDLYHQINGKQFVPQAAQEISEIMTKARIMRISRGA